MGLAIQDVTDFVATCPHLQPDEDGTGQRPVAWGLHDNGRTVLSASITGVRTFRHAYTLTAAYDLPAQWYPTPSGDLTSAFSDWVIGRNDAEIYPPVTDGVIEAMSATEAELKGIDKETKYGRFAAVLYIDYKEEK